MVEMHTRAQIETYLEHYRLQDVFNEKLVPYIRLYRFGQGELICPQGDLSENLYVLVDGKIKIFTTSPEGRTLILSFRNPIEIIGDMEYIHGGNIINTVQAVTPTIFLGIHYNWLNKFADGHAPFLRFMLDIITEKFYTNQHSQNFNLMYPVEVRLASYLLSVSFDETDASFNGQLTTAELADAANLIGTSYRHMNRVLKKFCDEGLVTRKKGLLKIINRECLQKVATRNIYE
ncbi:Crp/Fnr family transcriptional regulator [Neobacillus notoginsengisoli]|uniref:Crp/Fnr family transcriptional regulator n=1 Tax=Neobacillus notoginsengisoli TaxID=1578198 RepID=A0A417YX55_9BACI|nr:cyclic nucleotide-binding domain-containing protein [Neobacillus notoginsengisoli]RHW42012.1 Crp/Fnr family transcriptional regulator [Neobacillus notoginsengisoli]